MKILYKLLLGALLLQGCASNNVGYGVGGAVGGEHGGVQTVLTEDGVRGQVVLGGDFQL